MEQNTGAGRPNVLVVDDEREVADAYALRVKGVCDVEAVYDGETALERAAERPIDVLLLDRHMPGLSGDEVLASLADRGFDGQIVMVTAIDPGFDVLDMPFDDYLCKPLEREDVRAAVDHQCTVLGYELLGEYFSVESTRSVLEAELSVDERSDHPEYADVERHSQRLKQRIRRLLGNADELFDSFEDIGREGR
jgi:DNA-binding response OmpR family regulator